MTKQIHNLVQGSTDWKNYRLTMRGASEAAAMLGLSPNVSRTELLHMKHTATPQEFSDWVQKNILDYGHEVEAMARPLAEEIIGTELYPVTCSDGLLSASCDGLTMAEDEGWEHKQWNEALADSVANNVLPDSHQPQVQQELMVTGAQRWLFMVSDGTPERMVHMWVYPDQAWFERIRAGWAQFEIDLANYEPKQYAPKSEAEPIMSLPALAIQIRGEVAASNLPAFQARAERFIASIKTDLVTDQDFADAEATVKFCEKAEGDLEQTKRAVLEQTADIAEVMRTIDHVREQLRAKRLVLERTVKDKKELIKAGILANAKQAFADHVAALEKEIAPLRLVFQARDFAGAMKNKRTLATLQDAVDTELANGKIAVDAIAQAVRGRLTWYREHAADHEFLFADLQSIIQKPDEDFQMVVRTRIENHQRAEAEKAEQARQRAEAEERARAEAAARAQQEADARAAAAAQEQLRDVEPAPQAADVTPIDTARDPALADDAMLRLGQINERLAPIVLTSEGLARLGFAHVMTDKAAKLYRESDFLRICATLQRHISAVAQPKAA
jgi:predicted phage-related endonuclease